MKKYVDYIRIGIREHSVYPGAVWAQLFSKIMYLYLQFSIWNALFSSHSQINPLPDRENTLKYIIVAAIMSAFIECNIIERINTQIRTGNIAMELIRPIDFKKMIFSRHLGDSIARIVFYCIPLSVTALIVMRRPLLCHTQILYGLLSVILAYCIQFLYSLIIGLLAFWLIVTWPFNMLLGAVYKLLSGAWIPITMFPDLLNKINRFLPFRAIYAIPVMILTNAMEPEAISESVITQFIWIICLYVMTEIVWKVGKRKLIVQGG